MVASRSPPRRSSAGRTNNPPTRPGGAHSTIRPGWVALTGTPGTGKTTIGRRLGRTDAIEVRDLALRLGAGRRIGRTEVEVDLGKLLSRYRRYQRSHPSGVLVGHLAHLLPVAYVILLRCHPRELDRRLRRARRRAGAVAENVLAEALDVILVEALRRRLPIYEVDTTGVSPAATARAVRRILARRPRPRYGHIHWLSDPSVTAQLLRRRA